ncbi:rod shape-determining protein MreD [Ostreibacterium oceani]|uniref:Rod shape-determining protein MreD n=1 Tax=Ostreibacterium oceani TaxID=2654998 RepID=A0A6N7EVC7_9GAMM|nr:rod shape-determining protein MreD [Ostreibacterium oceani]MPV86422.1 rod shape-determining protein MreD [Ostreibacterium oceani]
MMNKIQQIIVIALLLLIALYLQEIPSSNLVQGVLPEWPLLLVIALSASSRYRLAIAFAFVVGLFQDVFLGVPTLGLHAAIYTLIGFIMVSARNYFTNLSVLIQAVFVAIVVLIKVFVVSLYYAILFSGPTHFWTLLSVPFSLIAWPLVQLAVTFFLSFFDEHTS